MATSLVERQNIIVHGRAKDVLVPGLNGCRSGQVPRGTLITWPILEHAPPAYSI